MTVFLANLLLLPITSKYRDSDGNGRGAALVSRSFRVLEQITYCLWLLNYKISNNDFCPHGQRLGPNFWILDYPPTQHPVQRLLLTDSTCHRATSHPDQVLPNGLPVLYSWKERPMECFHASKFYLWKITSNMKGVKDTNPADAHIGLSMTRATRGLPRAVLKVGKCQPKGQQVLVSLHLKPATPALTA